jgi:hypothetical protein
MNVVYIHRAGTGSVSWHQFYIEICLHLSSRLIQFQGRSLEICLCFMLWDVHVCTYYTASVI